MINTLTVWKYSANHYAIDQKPHDYRILLTIWGICRPMGQRIIIVEKI